MAPKYPSRSGQAMAELLVGLVGILFLIVGLQQIAIVSGKSFEAYTNSREQIANQLTDTSRSIQTSGDFIFVETVKAGTDGQPYTGDDQIIEGDDSFYTEGQGFLHMVDYKPLKSDYLDAYDLDDPYYRLSDSSFSVLSKSFSMHYGVDVQSVEVLPFLRKALGRDELNLKRDMFMPSWKGLMSP